MANPKLPRKWVWALGSKSSGRRFHLFHAAAAGEQVASACGHVNACLSHAEFNCNAFGLSSPRTTRDCKFCLRRVETQLRREARQLNTRLEGAGAERAAVVSYLRGIMGTMLDRGADNARVELVCVLADNIERGEHVK